ncbi:MAG: hypothetical protein LBC60_07410 [Spirochaetaceae bacterium]|jgi:hypothetical protein|nr:hypothetical protein [Spirochaetaceae bacterium]
MNRKIQIFSLFLGMIPLFLGKEMAAAEGFTLSGFLDSKVNFQGGTGDSGTFLFGWEEYANLRLQTNIGDRADFYGAFNFIAAAGSSALAAGSFTGAASNLSAASAFIPGDNYVAAMELERLYLRIKGTYLDVDTGLMRLGFGYGQVFSPSDFLNPRNPLFPDARPRAVLGAAVSLYPEDTIKLLAFTAAPKNPFNANGKGFLMGFSGDKHWDRASVQVLYSFESPQDTSEQGIHRTGLSLKADMEVGFTVDMLYRYNHAVPTGIEGLSLSTGVDYSFFDGNCYVLTEYLYNGAASSTMKSVENQTGFSNRNYLCGTFLYHFNDYTQINLTVIFGLDDISFSPSLSLDHDLFQGITLSLTGRIPLDRDIFTGNGLHGELGPQMTGTNGLVTAKLRVRF